MQPKALQKVERCLKALASPTRLAIFCVLKEGEVSVAELAQQIGTSQPNLSGHLATLRDKGLVSFRKEGNQVFYQVANPRLFEALELIQTIMLDEESSQL